MNEEPPWEARIFAGTPVGRRRLLAMCTLAAAAFSLPGCQSSAPAVLFDGPRRRTLAAVADTFLPRTDTPAASDAGVVEFVTTMVEGWMTEDERGRFVAGLAAFDDRARQGHGRPFADLPPARQHAYLVAEQAAARAAKAAHPPLDKAPFVVWMRRLTLFGYYTSEPGAATELELNLIPGQYQPHAHMAGDPHAFALDRTAPTFPVDYKPVFP